MLRGFGAGPAGDSRGLDLAADVGSPVRAAGAGIVSYAGTPARAYGALVMVEHEGGLHTVYGNLGEVRVAKGQRVETGDILATSGGKTGDLPPHLHFEVRRGQEALDPLLSLPPR